MKRSSFIKSLIAIPAIPVIAKALAKPEPVYYPMIQYGAWNDEAYNEVYNEMIIKVRKQMAKDFQELWNYGSLKLN
jgi:hypothetical protein